MLLEPQLNFTRLCVTRDVLHFRAEDDGIFFCAKKKPHSSRQETESIMNFSSLYTRLCLSLISCD